MYGFLDSVLPRIQIITNIQFKKTGTKLSKFNLSFIRYGKNKREMSTRPASTTLVRAKILVKSLSHE